MRPKEIFLELGPLHFARESVAGTLICEIFVFVVVALLFVFDKYCLTID
jgi:hypothetical protein